MAINGPRLAVDPVSDTTRAKLRLSRIITTYTRPPQPYALNDPVNGITVITQAPTRAGELILFIDTTNNRNVLLIATQIGLNLDWKEVVLRYYYGDSSTGEAFEAL
jgi:hypothetical protein